MLSKDTINFTKENLDKYLKELAKEFRKLNGKVMPAEITLVGGAAVLVNYGFRDMTSDVDAIIHASSAMRDAINRVRDKYDLPNGWLNTDFMRTTSYSSALNRFSVYYRTFSNVLTIRTISAEYLIAMKLCSGRKYKNDLSDIVGILAEHEKQGKTITMTAINKAVIDLYGGWAGFPEDSKEFIENTIQNGNYDVIYDSVSRGEKETKAILKDFEQEYPEVLKESNLNEILKRLKSRRENEKEDMQS